MSGEPIKIDQVLDMMASLGIVKVVYELNGSGDSGDVELGDVEYAPGRQPVDIDTIPVGLDGHGSPETLGTYLENHASNYPSGNWYDNDGGQGQVVYLPTETEGERIVENMEYNEESEDDDDYDYDGDDFEVGSGTDDGSDVDEDAQISIEGEKA